AHVLLDFGALLFVERAVWQLQIMQLFFGEIVLRFTVRTHEGPASNVAQLARRRLGKEARLVGLANDGLHVIQLFELVRQAVHRRRPVQSTALELDRATDQVEPRLDAFAQERRQFFRFDQHSLRDDELAEVVEERRETQLTYLLFREVHVAIWTGRRRVDRAS